MTVKSPQKSNSQKFLTIGQVAARTGLSVSAIRYYESESLVHPFRNSGGQRQFLRSDIRRFSFIMIAQKLGLPLEQIRIQLDKLPDKRTPTKKDWTSISKNFKSVLDDRIMMLTAMRDKLDNCIGCGCLSLKSCALYNPDDEIGIKGSGPRYLMGDKPSTK